VHQVTKALTALTVAGRSSSSPATWTEPSISPPWPAPSATIAVAPDDNKENKTTLTVENLWNCISMVSKLTSAWREESPISFEELGSTDGSRGMKTGQHKLSAHSQRHISKLILKSLLDRTSHLPGAMDEKVVLPLVRTRASIIAGSAPFAAMTFTGIPLDSSLHGGSTHSYDLVSSWQATTTNRKHRARTVASISL
jgi:hypothetical protein